MSYPDYDRLWEFITKVAEDDNNHAVLAAEAKVLLELPLPPFDPAMVLNRIRTARFAESETDMANELSYDLEALCILYGSQPIDYIVDRIEQEGLPDDWHVVLNELGSIDHEPTQNRRRLILERIMLETQSPRKRFDAMIELANMNDPRSIPAMETIVGSPIFKLVDEYAVRVLEQLQKKAAKQGE